MKLLPDVWGKGALFAYSGLDGENSFYNSMCGQLMAEHIGMYLDGVQAELYLRIKGTPWIEEIAFSLVASDLIEGTFNNNKEFKFLFLSQNTITGFCPAERAVPIFRVDLAEEKIFEGGKAFLIGDKWYVFVTKEKNDNIYFSLVRDTDFDTAFKSAEDALNVDIEPIANERKKYFDVVPELKTATDIEQKTLSKCFSVMKSQVYTAEGKFTTRWTTPDRIPHRRWWLWDSVFHTFGNIYIEPQLAYDTLHSILDVEDPDGFIPHMSTPEGYIYPHTQPPIIAWGLYKLYENTNRKDWVEEMYDGIKLFLDWIIKNRDSNDNYLYEWYVDPDVEVCRCGESGMDNTPRFDVVQLMDAIDFSCYMANEMRYMEKLSLILGLNDEAQKYSELYEKIKEQINLNLYDEKDGRYYDRELESGEFRKVSTPSGLLPLFAGVCSKEQAQRLVKDICNPETFGTPMPIPTVSLDDKYHSNDYWRGTVWICYNFMVEQGLREYGFIKEADRIVDSTLANIAHWYEREGCTFEIYDPQNRLCPSELDRKGPSLKPLEPYARIMAVRDFGWTSTLYVAMAMEREHKSNT